MTKRCFHPAGVLGPIALLLALTVTGCGAGGSGSASSAKADGFSGSTTDGAAVAPDVSSSTSSASDRVVSDQPVHTRAVISTGSVDLESKDVAKVRGQVRSLLTAHHGFLADEKTSTDRQGRATQTRLVLRVPSTTFGAVLTDLSKLGKLRHTSSTSKDVTTEVIDVQQRVRAQRIGLRRLEVLLGRAASLPNLLRVENEVTRRRADLDSLESQQAYLANQTALATITVRIDRSQPPAPTTVRHSGFGAGLAAGWHGLTVFLVGALTVIGAVLPFALVLLFLVPPGWVLLRLVRRHRAALVPSDG